MGYLVSVLPEVRDEDIPALPSLEVRRQAALIVRALYSDPRIGEPMRERYNLAILKGCRKVAFDDPQHKGKSRFRLVLRNEPSDGSVAQVRVLAIGARENLIVYRAAATRIGALRRGAKR